MNFERGDKVRVSSRSVRKSLQGLQYPAGIYTMLEAGTSGGWDVWDCIDPSGDENCIYGFSIEEIIE